MKLFYASTMFIYTNILWVISSVIWSVNFVPKTYPPPPQPSIPVYYYDSFINECDLSHGLVLERRLSQVQDGLLNNTVFPYEYEMFLYAKQRVPILQIRAGIYPENYTYSSDIISEQIGIHVNGTWNSTSFVFTNISSQKFGWLPNKLSNATQPFYEIMYADTRANPYGEILYENDYISILKGVSEWDNLVLDNRRNYEYDTQLRINNLEYFDVSKNRVSAAYCKHNFPTSRYSNISSIEYSFELNNDIDSCILNYSMYNDIITDFLTDYDNTNKFRNISISSLNIDCVSNGNISNIIVSNVSLGATGFLSNNSKFIKNLQNISFI